jgi:hypothetical protein
LEITSTESPNSSDPGTAHVTLRLKNLRHVPVVASQFMSSCNCTVINTPADLTIPGQGAAEVEVQVRRPRYGVQETSVSWVIEGRDYAVPLAVAGSPETIPRMTWIDQRHELRGVPEGGVFTSQLAWHSIERHSSAPWLKRVDCEPEAITAVIAEVQSRPYGHDHALVRRTYLIDLWVDMRGAERGIMSGMLVPRTESSPSVDMPSPICRVSAVAMSAVVARPSAVLMRDSGDDFRDVVLISNGERALAVEEVHYDQDRLTVSRSEGHDPRSAVYRISIRQVQSSAQPKVVESELIFVLDDPVHTRVAVPVVVIP